MDIESQQVIDEAIERLGQREADLLKAVQAIVAQERKAWLDGIAAERERLMQGLWTIVARIIKDGIQINIRSGGA